MSEVFNHKEEQDYCKRYLANIGLSTQVPVFVNFYEGRQWAPPTEATKNLPRPVINVIRLICSNKKAGVLSSRIKLNYLADAEIDTQNFNDFAEYMQREVRQPFYDKKAMTDGVIKGSYLYHYYWDTQAKGKRAQRRGAMRCEIFDPMSLAVSNPKEQDIQKQAWIQFELRYPLDTVMKMAQTDKIGNVIADTEKSIYGSIEKEGEKYCTVYLRYFKENGETFYEKATKGGLIVSPTSLTPDFEAAKKIIEAQMKIDPQEDATPDKLEIPKNERPVFSRYPVVFGSWIERNECLWGIGEVEGLINNQKSLNFGMAMQLLAAQNQAWGKWIVKKGALQGQEITNEPGQVLEDMSNFDNGIRRAGESGMSGVPIDTIEKLLEMTRVVTGATEVITGETLGSNMSGAAIAALQSQALKQIDDLQRSFWDAKEEQGLIYAEFMKFYYTNDEPFTKDVKQLDGTYKKTSDIFNGSGYSDYDIEVVVEAGAASTFSEASDINMLETMLNTKAITPKTFAKVYPKGSCSIQQKLLDAMEAEEKEQMAIMEQQIVQFQQQLKESATIIQEQSDTIDDAVKLIQVNKDLEAKIIQLEAEYRTKIEFANKFIAEATAKGKIAQDDAILFAQTLAKQAEGSSAQKT